MRFWDSSAILPLLVSERRSDALATLVKDDPAMVTWWATPIECASAIVRLEREGRLDAKNSRLVNGILEASAPGWIEVPPSRIVREQALRVLRLHPLRAGDALQLAAAIVAADFAPRSLPFVTLDTRLAAAAVREGFDLAIE